MIQTKPELTTELLISNIKDQKYGIPFINIIKDSSLFISKLKLKHNFIHNY